MFITSFTIERFKERWKIIQPQFARPSKKEDEFVWGEEVEVSDGGEFYNKAFYCCNNILNNKIIALENGTPYLYKYIRKLPLKTKLTYQIIADKFGIDVNNLEII